MGVPQSQERPQIHPRYFRVLLRLGTPSYSEALRLLTTCVGLGIIFAPVSYHVREVSGTDRNTYLTER